MVVIAIISLLAAILFPVFARARENARRASCQSNLKQLGLSIAQYTQDYDENYPAGYYKDATHTDFTGVGWGEKVYPYVKNVQVYLCPNEQRSIYTSGMATGSQLESYAINANLTNPTGDVFATLKSKVSNLNAPAKTVMLLETAFTSGYLTDTAITYHAGDDGTGVGAHAYGSPAC